MASIQSEYHRFLTHLSQREVHDDVRRLALLVLNHLESLAAVGAARRGRSTRLAPLAIAHLAQIASRLPRKSSRADAVSELGRLHQLQVGPFRGFMRPEAFVRIPRH
ncbi:ATPase, partial [Pseudomonas syringae pv. actinidiae]|nr:ATPase [Pseudomonas syringae pv. actinidiae]